MHASPSAKPPPEFPVPSQDDRSRPHFAVVGFGNVFQGDRGAGVYALEALEQAGFRADVSLHPLTGDYRALMYCLYGADAAVIIQAAAVTGRPGELHALDLPRFRTLAALDQGAPSAHKALAAMLAWIEVAHRLPRELLFLLIDPDPAYAPDGAGLSGPARRGVRRAVELAAVFLEKNGAARPAGHVPDRLYAIPWLGVTF
ncbi:hydrogenase maturation protease [Desulfolutivibrio sulfoxidireducens]|uniref:hydrogenase maturation protease n=1 Tax=Desulfolutivibrio sulfoxidireducens TaxID=2773299 RepID=UPI00159E0CB2|nr:hydrogenase maturation protease [Desulfolutivibrio sulfoxidireducens]QLA15487.1 hydrogenase maturation protease [Desulfolutivibrio sulfoxidireducens]QLA19085.1 hydrogenase maturation protease [Desulfolutivibrio sulfoxidireducens]